MLHPLNTELRTLAYFTEYSAKYCTLTCFKRCIHSPRDLSQIQSTLSRLTLSKCSAVQATEVTDLTWPRRCCKHSPFITSHTRTPPLAAPLTTWRLLVWKANGFKRKEGCRKLKRERHKTPIKSLSGVLLKRGTGKWEMGTKSNLNLSLHFQFSALFPFFLSLCSFPAPRSPF